jgi:pimeloyl-ACP methyl ester carboxylesterase
MSSLAAASAVLALVAPIAGPAGRLYVDDGGRGGLPVVFVHSFAGSGGHWSAQLAHLRPGRRAVALDLRGHGRSQAPAAGGYTVEGLAGDIAAVVDKLGLKRLALVGHSMGGVAATAYAGAHPDRMAGLVLVGTPGKSPPEQAGRVLASMEADYDKVTEGYWTRLLGGAQPGVAGRVRSDMKRLPREPSLEIMRAIFAYDPLPALRAYPGPKLIVDTPHGEGPGSLHNRAPEIPRQVITGTSHWPHMDKPEEFNRILDEFLEKVR